MKKITGFTLVEVMITIAIAGILLAFALPNYNNMTRNNCMTTTVNSLLASLQRARSEAIKRRTDIFITAAGADWSTGWSVWLDEDKNDDDVLDPGEDYDGDGVLDANVAIQNVALTCSASITEVSGTPKTSISYNFEGILNEDDGGTFNICDERTEEIGRQLTIAFTGRPNINSQFQCD